MEIKAFSDKVILTKKEDVLRLHLYTKLLQYGIKPFENDIDIILELYLFGGYSNGEQQALFIKQCLDKNLKKTEQSVRNILSKYTRLKVFDKPKNRMLKLNDKYLPTVNFDRLVLQHLVTHTL